MLIVKDVQVHYQHNALDAENLTIYLADHNAAILAQYKAITHKIDNARIATIDA